MTKADKNVGMFGLFLINRNYSRNRSISALDDPLTIIFIWDEERRGVRQMLFGK